MDKKRCTKLRLRGPYNTAFDIFRWTVTNPLTGVMGRGSTPDEACLDYAWWVQHRCSQDRPPL